MNRLTIVLLSMAGIVVPARAGRAAEPASAAEIARLHEEVRALRQVVMQLMRDEQEHYNLLLRLVAEGRAEGRGDAHAAIPAPSAAATGPATAAAPSTGAARADARADIGAGAGASGPARAPARITGSVRGTVQFPGGTLQDVYAYVENVKSPPVRSKTAEIVQRDKKFVPEVIVVQRGTKVLFPNYDNVFHNVFSPTPPRPFDLGSHRAGEEPTPVEMSSLGVVEVFCNMHSAMHASVLVVPSPIYTRVESNGSFHLDGVPLGPRKIVVWGPRSKPSTQTVEVGAAGAEVKLTLEAQPATAHNNKSNQPYPSYDKNKN
jgi:plastocyanin